MFVSLDLGIYYVFSLDSLPSRSPPCLMRHESSVIITCLTSLDMFIRSGAKIRTDSTCIPQGRVRPTSAWIRSKSRADGPGALHARHRTVQPPPYPPPPPALFSLLHHPPASCSCSLLSPPNFSPLIRGTTSLSLSLSLLPSQVE
jgi:hypothetical protein